jgi:hypothetical protein
MTNTYRSYYSVFKAKAKKCNSKKDYKRLCKEMLLQFDAIDKVDEHQWQIFSSILGEDAYSQGKELAVKMYILDQYGIPYDILSVEDKVKS